MNSPGGPRCCRRSRSAATPSTRSTRNWSRCSADAPQNVVEIGRLKGLLQMEIYQPAREEAVLRHVRSVNTGPLDGDAIARLFERIIDEARRLERAMAERGHS